MTFKSDDALKFAFPTETTAKVLIFASNGKFYTLDASKLPGGRGHGEPVRLYFDIEQDADVVAAMAFQGGRKFLVASYGGNGFIVPEDEVLGTTRKGKQVLNLKAPDKAAALTTIDGEMVASIGANRKMVIFKIDEIPEMTRGRGVRLQKYKEKGLSDVTTFKTESGKDQPAILLKPIAITRDNLNEVTDAKWIDKKDLCQGVTENPPPACK